MDDLEERLNAWRETPNEGDPMIDALLADIPEAADRLRQYREALSSIAMCETSINGMIARQALSHTKGDE